VSRTPDVVVVAAAAAVAVVVVEPVVVVPVVAAVVVVEQSTVLPLCSWWPSVLFCTRSLFVNDCQQKEKNWGSRRV
jgi:hypothetical protein